VAKVICDGCPCFNYDYENGSTCNLKFAIIPSNVADYESDVCELESVSYGGKYEFRPTLRAVDPPSALVGGGNSENSAGN
jgi:hypothetical protein